MENRKPESGYDKRVKSRQYFYNPLKEKKINDMKRKPDFLKILKIAIGAGLAIGTAESIGLKYSASAGIITLLSIQDTKKETIRVMVLRLLSFLVSLGLAAVCFKMFGYTTVAVCFFLLLFAPFSIYFHMEEGISVNTVLMTHFLAEQSMSFGSIANEASLLVIGAGIGVLLNLYIPGKKGQIRAMQQNIEEQMKGILSGMSLALRGSTKRCTMGGILANVEEELAAGEKSALEEMENNLLSETRYYLRYMNMRKSQTAVLTRMERQICHMEWIPLQAEKIALVMEEISLSFHEYNNAKGLLVKLYEVKASMREQPLPADRQEFENRALLYQILLELEEFLMIKRNFVTSLSEEEIKKFWEREM